MKALCVQQFLVPHRHRIGEVLHGIFVIDVDARGKARAALVVSDSGFLYVWPMAGPHELSLPRGCDTICKLCCGLHLPK